MLRLKNRRGVFVVLFGILVIGLMAAAAVSIDLSRTWAFRNELQTSADAAALAGAVQLGGGTLIAGQALDSARAYARKNNALGDTVSIELAELGHWNDTTSTYAATTPNNAVRVVLNHNVTNLWLAGLFGRSPFTIRARAIAWADAGISSSACLKPWVIPYTSLMFRLFRINHPTWTSAIPRDSLTRPFTPADLETLKTTTVAQRTFTLKIGSGNNTDSVTALNNLADSLKLPGNFQAVDLPPKWLKSTGARNPDWSSGNGGDSVSYKNSVAGEVCHTISVGDSLATKTGNMVGPTISSADSSDGKDPPGICKYIKGDKYDPAKTKNTETPYGDCMSQISGGSPGVDVKAAFYVCVTKCNGQTTYLVTMLGSFTLTKIYPGKTNYCAPKAVGCIEYDAGSIQGVFNPIQDPGAVGPSASTIRKIILVECQAARQPCT
jgi:hypothetical protein